MTVRLRHHLRLLTLGLLVVATCAACARFPAPASPPPIAFAVQPTPPGASEDDSRQPAPTADSCDATASLRPGPLPPAGEMPLHTTMASILGHGRLIVGLDTGSNPFSFRDPLTGDIQGFDVDIAQAIAQQLFGSLGNIEFRVLSDAERVQALQNHSVDIVVKTMSITCDRLRDVAFSSPYYVASQRILSVRGSSLIDADSLAGKRVCAARGATSIGRIEQLQPRVRMFTTDTWSDCLVMMQQGQVDAVTTDDGILAGLAEQDPWVQVVGPSLGAEYYGVGIPKGQDDMVRFVNGVLEQLRTSGRWQQFYDKWLSILGPGTGPPVATYRD